MTQKKWCFTFKKAWQAIDNGGDKKYEDEVIKILNNISHKEETMAYLIHFNQNHSSKNGQFVSGDGDGDGVSNDHKNQKDSKSSNKAPMSRAKARKMRNRGITQVAIGTGAKVVGGVLSAVVNDEDVSKGISFASSMFSAPLIIGGTVGIVRGAVGMGKASRRGDLS